MTRSIEFDRQPKLSREKVQNVTIDLMLSTKFQVLVLAASQESPETSFRARLAVSLRIRDSR